MNHESPNSGYQDDRFVLLRVAGTAYAVPTRCIVEMSALPDLTPHPHGRPDVRGIMRQRGRWIPVVDLRARLGLPSAKQETEDLVKELEQRERDHVNWLLALENSAREGVPFELATDPHRCAFGRWFDAYVPPNRLVEGVIRRFEAPHATIHGIAREVLDLSAMGELARATQIIEDARANELSEMKVLIQNAAVLLRDSQREIAVTVRARSGTLAITVDSADGVTELEVHPATGDSPLVCGLGKPPDRDQGVWVLDMDALVQAPREAA